MIKELEVSITALRLWEIAHRLQCALLVALTEHMKPKPETSLELNALHIRCKLTSFNETISNSTQTDMTALHQFAPSQEGL